MKSRRERHGLGVGGLLLHSLLRLSGRHRSLQLGAMGLRDQHVESDGVTAARPARTYDLPQTTCGATLPRPTARSCTVRSDIRALRIAIITLATRGSDVSDGYTPRWTVG